MPVLHPPRTKESGRELTILEARGLLYFFRAGASGYTAEEWCIHRRLKRWGREVLDGLEEAGLIRRQLVERSTPHRGEMRLAYVLTERGHGAVKRAREYLRKLRAL